MSIIRDIIYGAAARGASFHELCQRVHIDPQELNDAEKMVHWERAPYLWDHVMAMTGDELIGLHMGEEARPNFGMLGHLMQTCRTVKDAIEAVVQFNNIFSTIFQYSLEYTPHEAHFCFEPSPLFQSKYPVSARQAVEISMSSTLRIIHTLTGRKIYPLNATLVYPKRNVTEYQRIFQTAVRFDASSNCLTFSKESFATPVLGYDPSLFSLFNSLLIEKQTKHTARKTMAEEVRHRLLTDFKGQIPVIEVMAAHMGFNTRTFQRKLSAENSSYRIVCQDLRKELALAMMGSTHKKVSEVAILLGYADPTTFRRAFKSWTHVLPKEVKDSSAIATRP